MVRGVQYIGYKPLLCRVSRMEGLVVMDCVEGCRHCGI